MNFNSMVFLGTAYVNADNLSGLVISGKSHHHVYQVLFVSKNRNEDCLPVFESKKKSECAEFIELAVQVLKKQSDKEAAAELKRFVEKHTLSVDSKEEQVCCGPSAALFDAIFKQVPKENKESEETKSGE